MCNKVMRINPDPRKANKSSLSNLRRAFLSDPGLTPDRRRKISSYLLVGLWSFVSLTCVTFGFPRRARASDAPAPRSSITGTVCVITGQGEVNNIAGVAVKLSSPSAESTSQSTLTDENGGFRFTQLAAGAYTLEVNVEGFKPWTKTVALGQSQAAVEDATLEISTVDEKIEVQGDDLDVSTHSAETTGTVTNSELETLPLAQQKFTEALPLSPGVIHTPEGRLSFNGQAENQGILLVNSTENVDPVTGSFAIPVPVDVIQSMSVHSSPDTAEFGGFSGGLTEIEIRPAFDTWNFKLHDMSPSFRAENGHLTGLGAFTPRMVLGGPLVKGKLNFTEELTYEVRNKSVRGLSWPFNQTETRSVTSFTQFQFILSPRHLLDVNFNVFPLRRQFADINALVPQSASNTYGQNGVSLGISDSYQLSSGGLLNTVVRYTRFDSHAHGQGAEDMLVTPDGWGGNFFNTWSRNANELEVRPAFQFPDKSWHGRHEFKIGVDITRRSFVGTDISRPIQVLRQDNSVAEQISFEGPGLQNGASTEVGEFIEDHWILDSHLAIDAGVRLSSQSIGRGAALGPHIGVAYSPRQNGRTIIRASAGTVYGHVPLLADTFLDDPTRVISFFDPSGKATGEPISLQNAYLQSDGRSGPQFVSAMPRTSPRTFTWSVEVEREIRRNVSLKVGYLDSQTRNLFVVDPLIDAAGSGSVLALANNGTARYRRIEATIHARPFEHGDLNVSYVWSRSRGDLNTLADTYMPFEEPVIRPNVSGILASDVPHRVVTWGIFSLPWKLTFSPVVDVRTGLPYSNVDALQNYVGVPNSMRFPTFFSLDGRLYREFPLRLPFMEKSTKRKIRLGVYTNNLTNHRNPHDVFSNVASPLFGQFAGFLHRTDGFVIDIVD
jgi:Carboxypeptidase regulatory-like domain